MHYFVIPALIAIIYIFIVRPKIKQYRAVSGIIEKADAAGASIWGKFLARLSGLKTPPRSANPCLTSDWRLLYQPTPNRHARDRT